MNRQITIQGLRFGLAVATFSVVVSACASLVRHTRHPVTPTLQYSVAYDPAVPFVLKVSLDASGVVAAGRSHVLRLSNWGEWTETKSGYVKDLQVNGAAIQFNDRGELVLPSATARGGHLHVDYSLRIQQSGSDEQQAHPLLPYRKDDHVFGFVKNTLVELMVDGAPRPGEVTIRIEAPLDYDTFTGWAGLSKGGQRPAPLKSLVEANGIFAIGRSFRNASRHLTGGVVEVVQIVPGPDQTLEVAEVAAAIIASSARAVGRAPQAVTRVVVDRSRAPGVFNGTHTAAGLVVYLPAASPMVGFAKELIAHELLHSWLGTSLVEDGSLVWFSEGFTDYLSLWHAVATSQIPPSRFAERLLDVERQARTSPSFGRRPFADSSIQWRDGNGPNEILGYRGGALLAFAVDAELRLRGDGTVSAIVQRLLASTSGAYHLADVHRSMELLGLSSRYERSIAGTELPDARELLVAIGFDDTIEPASLTYLGLEARFDGPSGATSGVPAIVTALDPEGPAFRAGLREGDRIVGYGPTRGNPPMVGAEAPSRFRFGLNLIASGAAPGWLDIERNGTGMRLEFIPRLMRGGHRMTLQWNPTRGAKFFDVVTDR